MLFSIVWESVNHHIYLISTFQAITEDRIMAVITEDHMAAFTVVGDTDMARTVDTVRLAALQSMVPTADMQGSEAANFTVHTVGTER